MARFNIGTNAALRGLLLATHSSCLSSAFILPHLLDDLCHQTSM